MLYRYKYRNKKKILIGSFIKKIPSLTVISSVFGFSSLWIYLKGIEHVEVFTQINLSTYGVISILVFFLLVFFCFVVNFFLIFLFLYPKNQISIRNQKERLLYAITQPTSILVFLSVILCIGYSDLNEESRCITIVFLCISAFLFILSIYLYFMLKGQKDKFRSFGLFSVLSSLSPIYLLIHLIGEAVEGDVQSFSLVLVYLFLLGSSNLWILSNKRSWYSVFIPLSLCFIFMICVAYAGEGYKLQRIILKPIGIAQESSQSGWYFLKNKDLINYIVRNDVIKIKRSEDGSEDYIYGYLILNIGNIRVICPEDLEDVEDKEKLDFSRCLNFTSEDIRFMGKRNPFRE